jgi:hypothetical protein
MVYPDSWKGFQIEDPSKWTDFKLNELKPKPFGDFDVDIKILACGVCASDLHTISGGWGEQKFPLCVGHGPYFILIYYTYNFLHVFPFSFPNQSGYILTRHRDRWKSSQNRIQSHVD